MAGTDPWTGARLGDDQDSPLGGTFLARVITDLRGLVTPRFATVSDRDAAVNQLTVLGSPIKNGATCWTDDAGFWVRIGGAWLPKWRDTGWQNITPNSPFTVGPNGAKYAVRDGMCEFSMDVTRTSSWSNLAIFTFPAGVTPPIPWYVHTVGPSGIGNSTISTAGVVTCGVSGSANDHMYLSGVFPVY